MDLCLHGPEHGMSYSASELEVLCWRIRTKPVILQDHNSTNWDLRTMLKKTGYSNSDCFNFRENGKPIIHEVCLYFEYKLFAETELQK